MNPVINFVELENRVISVTYRNLMIGAKVVLVDKSSGEQLPDPVARITSPVPVGSLQVSLPASVSQGTTFEGPKRAWPICHAKCRVFGRLTVDFLRIFRICLPRR